MKIQSFFAPVREFFFPRGCALCGGTLTGREETLYGLCDPCRARLSFPAGDAGTAYCDRCGRPLISEMGRCLPCRGEGERLYERTAVVYPYSGKYRKLLGEYKFGRNTALGFFLAERLKEACAQLLAADSDAAAIGQGAQNSPLLVPIPPRPGKLRKTGWDQVEYLARLLKREGLPVYRCLRRLPSLSQKKLNREERLRNLRDRFVLTRPAPGAAVLFDDVITTGATLEACAGALKNGGTEKVYAACLFYD
ncbi:MAG: double zinc ribbon domain-containing protein [Treponema sp.]|jgi:ComF family protein|nr:double zinc ribbon domain-containing protein [Treponema sp.]